MDSINRFLSSKPYSRNTRERYSRILRELVALPGLDSLTAIDLLNFIEKPAWGNAMRCLALATCKVFLRYTYGDAHPALAAKIKRRRSKPQRTLTPAQANRLLCSFNHTTTKGKRDLAIAALAIDTGLRLAELCSLKIEDYHPEQLTLMVIVKGGEWETAIYSEQTALFIGDWLQARNSTSPNIFTNIRTGKPLSREGLQTIIKKWGRDLGIKLSPHDLRRTFATLATRNGAPSRVVQRAGRWSDMQMVALYTRQLDQEAIIPYLPVRGLLQA